MGEVVRAEHLFRRNPDAPVNKKQLAGMLGYSVRWVEMRVREGMPSTMKGNRRMFVLSECLRWLDQRDEKESANG